jgi:SAM-dependent methyltransferase
MAGMPGGLPVPPELQRGTHKSRDAWIASGRFAAALLAETVQRPDLSGVDVLDVGCGTKIVKTIIDDGLPVGRYVGVDVASEVIEWLDANVVDPRFEFHHFAARNDLYNPTGPSLSEVDRLPVGNDTFDLICLFSVFTHLAPDDYVEMLRLTRQHIRPDGLLLFSVFIDEPDGAGSPYRDKINEALASGDPEAQAKFAEVFAQREQGYWDAIPERPLEQARYTRAKALELIDQSDWELIALHPRSEHIQHHAVCRPV